MSTSEIRQCQNCKSNFIIEAEDFDFYEKIKVPPPTWCAECRLVRRMHFRNERMLYRGKCELCGKATLCIYSSDKPFHTYCHDCWWSDKWDVMDYGVNYNFNKPFFQQWRDLLEITPRLALSVKDMTNSDYCNVSEFEKDCYLVSAGDHNEGIMYSNRIVMNKDSVDLYIGQKNELCYELVNCLQCWKVFFSRNCVQCRNSAFLLDCSNCSECFSCVNLKNKKHCVFNKQYTEAEYRNFLKDFDFGSYTNLARTKEKFNEFLLRHPHKFGAIIRSVNASGDNIRNAKNCQFCFDVIGDPSAENCRFAFWAGEGIKDCYDAGVGGGLKIERSYEITDAGLGCDSVLFATVVYSSFDVRYSVNCYSSSHLFACIGLRNKRYCILNKQYSEQEYKAIVPKIVEQMNSMPYMDKKGRAYKYGEFFPPELSPFCYNETIAQEYFALSEAEAESKGFRWKKPEPRNYQIDIKTDQLPDNIKDVKDDIVGKVIECAHKGTCNEQCTEAFKIIAPELQFYRRMNLPLPRLCPNCRHYQRLKQRNPLKLWKRQCMCQGAYGGSSPVTYQNTCSHEHGQGPCPSTFETSYAPDRPEIVYCEACYLKEVV